MKKKKYRALKKTEIAVDVIKFSAYKTPHLAPYHVVYSKDPTWPAAGFMEVIPLEDDVLLLVVPKGDTLEDYDLDEALG